MLTATNISALITFFGVTGITFLFSQIMSKSDRRALRRVDEELKETNSLKESKDSVRNRAAQLALRLFPTLSLSKDATQGAEQNALQARLRSAGYYQPQVAAVFAVITILLAVLPSLVAIALLGFSIVTTEQGIWIALIGGCVGLLIPGMWLDRQKKRRHVMFMKAIPDFLDLLITCLSSGLSLEASIKRVTDEIGTAHPLLYGELLRVQKEMSLGESVDKALMSFATRTECRPVKNLAVLCQQARQFGTKITDALRAHADLLRSQRELIAEERAQKATVKMLLPVLLLIFPAVFVVLAGPAAIGIWENLASPTESADEAME